MGMHASRNIDAISGVYVLLILVASILDVAQSGNLFWTLTRKTESSTLDARLDVSDLYSLPIS